MTAAIVSTAGTNTPATRSASRCTGARVSWARATRRTIWLSAVSRPTAVARTVSAPSRFTVAPALADVVFGLSGELELRGHAVEIVLPKYDCMRCDRVCGLTPSYERLEVPWSGGAIECTVWFGFVDGRRCFFIEPHSREGFFERGDFYGSSDDVARFAFFSKAALEFMLRSDKRPDVIHCHDWQTGLVPVLLYELYQRAGMPDQRVVYTIHNIGHQGVSGEWALALTGLGPRERFFRPERMLDNHNPFALNIMKGGIVYANFVTTVSPRYAWEVRHCDMGMGLGPTLHAHQGKFGGILNGVNYETWNPEVDSLIPRRYGADSIDDKRVNRRALRDRFLLRDVERPIVAYIGRIDFQKGVHLIHHALYYALDAGAQFVLLGSSPDPAVHEHFQHQRRHLNDNPDCHLELRFSAELAHLIYAGADLLVMPSVFEPCGLAPMIAMKYGTVPIVRAVGGLAATVFDRDHSLAPACGAQRVRVRPRRRAGAGVGDGPRDRPMALRPRRVPRPPAQRHAGGPLVGRARAPLPRGLRPRQAPVSGTPSVDFTGRVLGSRAATGPR